VRRDDSGDGGYRMELHRGLSRSRSEPPPEPTPDALILAAKRGNADDVRAILAAGCRPSEEAARWAVRQGYALALDELFQAGLPLSCVPRLRSTAATARQRDPAALLDYYEIVRLAVRAAGPFGRALAGSVAADPPPLHRVARCPLPGPARRLLDVVGNVDARDAAGRTALHVAAGVGVERVVRMLLKAGADPSARDAAGETPLHLALGRGDAGTYSPLRGDAVDPVTSALLDAGANPNAAAANGDTPLHIAARRHLTQAVELLSRHRATVAAAQRSAPIGLPTIYRIHAPWSMGGGCIIHSGGSAESPVIDALVRQGVPWSLEWAAARAKVDVVRRLLDEGADARAVNDGGLCPLVIAAGWAGDEEGRDEVVRALLAAGADPMSTAPDGYTALMLACERGYPRVIAALLEAGADPNVARVEGAGSPEPRSRGFDEPHRASSPLEALVTGDHARTARAHLWGRASAQPRVDACVTVLLRGGARPTLDWAAAANQPHVIAALRPEPNGYADWTPELARALGRATEGGCADAIAALVADSIAAWPAAACADALWTAVALDDERSVAVLLRAGVPPDVRNRQGETPLHYVAASHEFLHLIPSGTMGPAARERMARALLHGGADPTAVSSTRLEPRGLSVLAAARRRFGAAWAQWLRAEWSRATGHPPDALPDEAAELELRAQRLRYQEEGQQLSAWLRDRQRRHE
jgi:ankyrin repeat protein